MSSNTGRKRPRSEREAAEAAFDKWLSSQLHAMYADEAHEPLPPSLVLMLKGLERPTSSRWTLLNVRRPQKDTAAETDKEQTCSDGEGRAIPGPA